MTTLKMLDDYLTSTGCFCVGIELQNVLSRTKWTE